MTLSCQARGKSDGIKRGVRSRKHSASELTGRGGEAINWVWHGQSKRWVALRLCTLIAATLAEAQTENFVCQSGVLGSDSFPASLRWWLWILRCVSVIANPRFFGPCMRLRMIGSAQRRWASSSWTLTLPSREHPKQILAPGREIDSGYVSCDAETSVADPVAWTRAECWLCDRSSSRYEVRVQLAHPMPA